MCEFIIEKAEEEARTQLHQSFVTLACKIADEIMENVEEVEAT